MKCSVFVTLALALAVAAAPQRGGNSQRGNQGRAGQQQNGNKGQQNGQFGQNGQNGQKGQQSQQGGKAATTSASAAAAATSSAAAGDTGTEVSALTGASGGAAIAAGAQGGAVATGASGGVNATGDLQTSLTLDPSVIAKGFADDGQDVPAAGQVASLTSTNNFINFCATVPNLPLTNGQQVTAGSCNPAPMGIIPSNDNMPSAKFTNPKNGDTIAENTEFTISMAISGMQTGFFVNADENYFAAPQQVNAQGQIIGHSHVVVEALTALDQTTTTNPKVFAFFKGLNSAASGGILTADVTNGLPAGVYKLSSINTAANHQPVLVPVAQHGSLDDAVYFTVSANGAAASNSTASAGGAAAASNSTAAAAGTAASSSAAAGAAAASSSAAAGGAGAAAAGAGAAAASKSAAAGAAAASATTKAVTGSGAAKTTGNGAVKAPVNGAVNVAAGKGKRMQLSRMAF